MLSPTGFHYVKRATPLNDAGMWAWLSDKIYTWEPDPNKAHVNFWFKHVNDAVMFKLMWA